MESWGKGFGKGMDSWSKGSGKGMESWGKGFGKGMESWSKGAGKGMESWSKGFGKGKGESKGSKGAGKSTVVCRYGADCKRPDCWFAHPEREHGKGGKSVPTERARGEPDTRDRDSERR